MSSYRYLYQYFRIWYLGYVPFVSLFICNFGMWPHSSYLLHTVHCFCSRICVSRFMFVTTNYLVASCVSCPSHWFVSSFTVCLSYLLTTWWPVFKQRPCVYDFCSVIYFRGSYKTMDRSKVSPSCGNIMHIWQSLWTTLYQIVILPVWYGIMFLLIPYCFTVFFVYELVYISSTFYVHVM
jgi:hypothetical protein